MSLGYVADTLDFHEIANYSTIDIEVIKNALHNTDKIFVLFNVNNKTSVIKGDPSILSSNLCLLNTRIMRKEELLIYNSSLVYDEYNVVCALFNDKYYLTKCISSIEINNIADARMLLDSCEIKSMPNKIAHFIDQYIDLIDCSKYAWESVASKPDFASYRLSKRHWKGVTFNGQRTAGKEIVINANIQTAELPPRVYGEYPNARVAHEVRVQQEDITEITNFGIIMPLNLSDYNLESYPEFEDMCKFIFEYGSSTMFWQLIFNTLLSINSIHYIFHREIISMISQKINTSKEKADLSYYLFYGLYILNHEERIMRTRMTHDHRFIHHINNVCDMPMLPIYIKDTLNYSEYEPTNGYIPIILNEGLLKNTLMIMEGKRRIVTLDEFKLRLHIFSFGILDNVNFKECCAYLNGSTMLATIAITPVEFACREKKGDNYLRDYFEFYYPSYNSLTKEQFKRHIRQFSAKDAESVHNDEPLDAPVLISDIDVAISCATNEEFDIYAVKFYEQVKRNYPDARLSMIIKWFDKEAIENNAKPKHYKYKISSPRMMRHIDLFHIKEGPAQLIGRFHLPCVRSWYDGEDVYITTSCLSALMSGINHSYHWFAYASNYHDIILKYMMRGYTTILTEAESNTLKHYYGDSYWKHTENTAESLLRIRDPTHGFFIGPKHGIRHNLKEMSLLGDYNCKEQITKYTNITQSNVIYRFGVGTIIPPNKI